MKPKTMLCVNAVGLGFCICGAIASLVKGNVFSFITLIFLAAANIGLIIDWYKEIG